MSNVEFKRAHESATEALRLLKTGHATGEEVDKKIQLLAQVHDTEVCRLEQAYKGVADGTAVGELTEKLRDATKLVEDGQEAMQQLREQYKTYVDESDAKLVSLEKESRLSAEVNQDLQALTKDLHGTVDELRDGCQALQETNHRLQGEKDDLKNLSRRQEALIEKLKQDVHAKQDGSHGLKEEIARLEAIVKAYKQDEGCDVDTDEGADALLQKVADAFLKGDKTRLEGLTEQARNDLVTDALEARVIEPSDKYVLHAALAQFAPNFAQGLAQREERRIKREDTAWFGTKSKIEARIKVFSKMSHAEVVTAFFQRAAQGTVSVTSAMLIQALLLFSANSRKVLAACALELSSEALVQAWNVMTANCMTGNIWEIHGDFIINLGVPLFAAARARPGLLLTDADKNNSDAGNQNIWNCCGPGATVVEAEVEGSGPNKMNALRTMALNKRVVEKAFKSTPVSSVLGGTSHFLSVIGTDGKPMEGVRVDASPIAQFATQANAEHLKQKTWNTQAEEAVHTQNARMARIEQMIAQVQAAQQQRGQRVYDPANFRLKISDGGWGKLTGRDKQQIREARAIIATHNGGVRGAGDDDDDDVDGSQE